MSLDKVALGQVFTKYLAFPLSVSFHRHSVFIRSPVTDAIWSQQMTSSSNTLKRM